MSKKNLILLRYLISFNSGLPKAPHTFFENIYEVAPGKVLEWEFNNFVEQNCSTKNFFKTNDKNAGEILLNSVERHLPSGIQAGIFLSGGVDSTLLLAAVNELGHKNLPCFTISNNGLTDDVNFAKQAALRFNGGYHEINLEAKLKQSFGDFVSMVDQPVADPGLWMTSFLADEAKQNGLRVILSGAGADELFGGYNRHKAFKNYLKYYQLLQPALKYGKIISPILPKNFRQIKKFLSQAVPSPTQTFINFTSLLPVFENNFCQTDHNFENDLLSWALNFDRDNYLVHDVLKITDMMAMRHSVEVRMPFLDNEMIEYCKNLSGNYILKNGQKWILKNILNEKGGHAFTKRKKQGLGFSFVEYLKSPYGKETVALLRQPVSKIYQYIAYQNVQKILNIHLSGKEDYTTEIYAVALLAQWIEINF